MGMFDYLACEVELPGPRPAEMQTKSLDCTMAQHRIRADGRLMLKHVVRTESVPKPERPFPDAPDDSLMSLAGSIRTTWEEAESTFTGSITFYGTVEGVWVEYIALFRHGQLLPPIERVIEPEEGEA